MTELKTIKKGLGC